MKLLSGLASMVTMAATVLREVFDEAAYERFLAQRHLASSAGAYAEFCQGREQMKVRRPRCC